MIFKGPFQLEQFYDSAGELANAWQKRWDNYLTIGNFEGLHGLVMRFKKKNLLGLHIRARENGHWNVRTSSKPPRAAWCAGSRHLCSWHPYQASHEGCFAPKGMVPSVILIFSSPGWETKNRTSSADMLFFVQIIWVLSRVFVDRLSLSSLESAQPLEDLKVQIASISLNENKHPTIMFFSA